MRAFVAVVIGLHLVHAVPASAQRTVEITGGAGYTSVDLESFYGGELEDWGMPWYGVHALVVPFEVGDMGVGLEAGWQYLAWFDYNSLGTIVTRELSAADLMAVLRVPFNRTFFSEFRAGAFMFDEFTDLAVGAALGGRIPISPQWSLPVKIRTDIILDEDTNFVPIAVELGVAYEFP